MSKPTAYAVVVGGCGSHRESQHCRDMEFPRFRVMASSFFCDEPVNPCRNIERETLQSGDLHPLRRDLSKVQGLVFDSCNTCGLYQLT